MKHLRIRVSGRVQGVFYRQSTFDKASELGLCGTVQNLSDGSVEIHAEGNEDKLQEFLDWCKNGPDAASVTNVESHEEKVNDFQSFRII